MTTGIVMIETQDTNQTAERIKCHPGSLARLRVRGDGPPFIKVGRSVRYDPRDVDEWLAKQKRTSTSQRGAA